MNKLEQTYQDFENLRRNYSNLGAMDTEPRVISEIIIEGFIIGNPRPIPHSSDGWQLYSSEEGSQEAARALQVSMTNLIKVLGQASFNDVRKFAEQNGFDYRT